MEKIDISAAVVLLIMAFVLVSVKMPVSILYGTLGTWVDTRVS